MATVTGANKIWPNDHNTVNELMRYDMRIGCGIRGQSRGFWRPTDPVLALHQALVPLFATEPICLPVTSPSPSGGLTAMECYTPGILGPFLQQVDAGKTLTVTAQCYKNANYADTYVYGADATTLIGGGTCPLTTLDLLPYLVLIAPDQRVVRAIMPAGSPVTWQTLTAALYFAAAGIAYVYLACRGPIVSNGLIASMPIGSAPTGTNLGLPGAHPAAKLYYWANLQGAQA